MNEFTVVDIARPGDVVILGLEKEIGIEQLNEIAGRLQLVTEERDVSFMIFEKGIKLIEIIRKDDNII